MAMSFLPTAKTFSPTAGLVDRSADFVGDAGADRFVTRYGEGYS
jgi:hypothetical protein